jgi:formylglycine-generating enzyme required for sulfatase activity
VAASPDVDGTIVNSIGMKLVPIPAGEFLMGSPPGDPLGDQSEEFQHPVRVSRLFFMGMYAVTQREYVGLMGTNPSYFEGERLPVEHLAWADSVEFCQALSELPEEQNAGRTYRLPTEAEWEYACRAGIPTRFNTGDELPPSAARFSAINRGNPKQTAPVGTYPPNAWGLHEMHGNVWEWTADWFSARYYRKSPVNDPQGPSRGTHHTLRGGSASVQCHECRSAQRGEAPHDAPEDDSNSRYAFYGDFGMRVVCEVQVDF